MPGHTTRSLRIAHQLWRHDQEPLPADLHPPHAKVQTGKRAIPGIRPLEARKTEDGGARCVHVVA